LSKSLTEEGEAKYKEAIKLNCNIKGQYFNHVQDIMGYKDIKYQLIPEKDFEEELFKEYPKLKK